MDGLDVEAGQIFVLSLETEERKILVDGTYPRYSPTGHIVFARENSLFRTAARELLGRM